MQGLQGLYDTYSAQGFVAISVVAQDGSGAVPTPQDAAVWEQGLGLTFPVLADTEGDFFPLWDPRGMLPMAYIIDAEGVVTWVEIGGASGLDAMEDQIVTLLDEN